MGQKLTETRRKHNELHSVTAVSYVHHPEATNGAFQFALAQAVPSFIQIHQIEVTSRKSIMATTRSITPSIGPTYYLGAVNGANLIQDALKKLNWDRSFDRLSDSIILRWTECLNQINFSQFKEGEHMVNHFPNCGLITNKLGLLFTLRAYESRLNEKKNHAPTFTMKEFFPDTYIIDEEREKHNFFRNIQKDGELWIDKPTGLNQGKGIRLIRSKAEFITMLEERTNEWRINPSAIKPRIIQRYISHPLLLDGRKFDIRSYVLIANAIPFLVLYHPGYVRLSTKKYVLEDVDMITHLTNQYIQKKSPNYSEIKNDTIWSMEKMNDYVNKYYKDSKHLCDNWVNTTLQWKMQKIVHHLFMAIKNKLICKVGFFEIYGLDFMVDSNMKVYFIEANINPALQTHCEVLRSILPNFIQNSLYISIECFEKARRGKPLIPIVGIQPLSPESYERVENKKPMTISLNELNPNTSKSGLPPGFTIIFSEGSEAAKLRQVLCANVALTAWKCPRYKQPSANHLFSFRRLGSPSTEDGARRSRDRSRSPGQSLSTRTYPPSCLSIDRCTSMSTAKSSPRKLTNPTAAVPLGESKVYSNGRSQLPSVLKKFENVDHNLTSQRRSTSLNQMKLNYNVNAISEDVTGNQYEDRTSTNTDDTSNSLDRSLSVICITEDQTDDQVASEDFNMPNTNSNSSLKTMLKPILKRSQTLIVQPIKSSHCGRLLAQISTVQVVNKVSSLKNNPTDHFFNKTSSADSKISFQGQKLKSLKMRRIPDRSS